MSLKAYVSNSLRLQCHRGSAASQTRGISRKCEMEIMWEEGNVAAPEQTYGCEGVDHRTDTGPLQLSP